MESRLSDIAVLLGERFAEPNFLERLPAYGSPRYQPRHNKNSLSGGHAGFAVFYCGLAEIGIAGDWELAAKNHLAQIRIEEASLGLWSGLSGAYFAFKYANRLFGGLQSVCHEILQAIIRIWVATLAGSATLPATSYFEVDLVSGLAGTILALDGDSSVEQTLIGALGRNLESRLRRAAIAKLITPNMSQRVVGVNLGVAHGVAGISSAARHAAEISGACSSLLSWLDEEFAAWYRDSPVATWIDESGNAPASRPGWCYGFPGVIAAVPEVFTIEARQRLGATLNDDIRTLRDSGLCHGTVGAALCLKFAGAGQYATVIGQLKNRAMNTFTEANPYLTQMRDQYGDAFDDGSLLHGAAGAVLGLLALEAHGDTLPYWTRAFGMRVNANVLSAKV